MKKWSGRACGMGGAMTAEKEGRAQTRGKPLGSALARQGVHRALYVTQTAHNGECGDACEAWEAERRGSRRGCFMKQFNIFQTRTRALRPAGL